VELRESAKLGVPRSGLRGAMSLLARNRDFRNLYVAQLVSYGGDWFLTVALFGLVLDTTRSPVMASLVLVSQMVPFFVFSPLGGVLADRLDRQRLMVAADLTRTALCFGFLLVNAGDVWLAFVLQAALAALGAMFDPASSAAVPNLVDEEDLATANVLVGSAWGTMLAIGAALGGLVAAAFGRNAAFMGDAASFAISATLLATIRRSFSEAREGAEHETFVRATVETLRYAKEDRRVLALISVKGGFGFASGVIVLLSVFAHQVFHKGDVGIGVLFAARGLGALIGPFIGRTIAGDDMRGLFRALGLALTTYGVFYSVFGLMPTLWIAAPFAAGAHLGGGAQWTLSTYGLQRIVPDRIRGRVFAFDFAFVTASITISNLVAGWSSERFGPRATMVGLAAVAASYAIVWWTATRRVRRTLV
jgi:MFS family permease